MQYDAIRSKQCNTMQYRYNALQYGTIQYRYNTITTLHYTTLQ
jgi:hypothetical protein